MSKLDDTLLGAFINSFYGYGNLDAPYWFIGMEEGGGNDLPEIQRRLETWLERGQKVTEDLVDYHVAIGITKYFDSTPGLQSTWRKLIRVLHILEEKSTTNDAMRQTQRASFGRSSGSSCLLELLPLPSPSINHWHYGEWTNLSCLKDRETYRSNVIEHRSRNLQKLIQQYKPRVVLFYGWGYRDLWQTVSDSALNPEAIGKFPALLGRNERTLFVVTYHPTVIGITNDYFNKVGEQIRNRIE